MRSPGPSTGATSCKLSPTATSSLPCRASISACVRAFQAPISFLFGSRAEGICSRDTSGRRPAASSCSIVRRRAASGRAVTSSSTPPVRAIYSASAAVHATRAPSTRSVPSISNTPTSGPRPLNRRRASATAARVHGNASTSLPSHSAAPAMADCTQIVVRPPPVGTAAYYASLVGAGAPAPRLPPRALPRTRRLPVPEAGAARLRGGGRRPAAEGSDSDSDSDSGSDSSGSGELCSCGESVCSCSDASSASDGERLPGQLYGGGYPAARRHCAACDAALSDSSGDSVPDADDVHTRAPPPRIPAAALRGGGKPKRPPTARQRAVGEYMKKHGVSLGEASRAISMRS